MFSVGALCEHRWEKDILKAELDFVLNLYAKIHLFFLLSVKYSSAWLLNGKQNKTNQTKTQQLYQEGSLSLRLVS